MNQIKTALQIALIEDDKAMADSIFAMLKGYELAIEVFPCGKAVLQRKNWDCFSHLILDLSLPDVDGIELLPQLYRLAPTCSLIIISGHSVEVIQAAVSYAQALGFSVVKQLRKPFFTSAMRSILDLVPQEGSLQSS